MAVVTIRQGDSLRLVYGLGTDSLDGWTCDVAVKTHAAQATPVYELTLVDLEEDDTRYTGLIPGSETATWDARRYIVVCDLYNSVTDEAKEFEATLIVSGQAQVVA
jgi:hypothetical protein